MVDSGRFILGPRVGEAEKALAAHVGVAHGIGVAQRHRRARDRAARARHRAGRRGHLPVVHLLLDRRVDRRDRRGPGVRRHRGRDATTSTPAPSRPRSRRARARSCRCTCSAIPPTWARSRRSRSAHGLALLEDAAQAFGAVARRRALRRARRRRHVLVLPHQEPAVLRRRRPDRDGERRGRSHVPRAALPRLRGQEDVHARRLQLAPRRAAGRDPARAAAARRRLERRAASPSPRAMPSSASASTSCSRRSPRARATSTTSTSCAAGERERLMPGLAEAGVASATYYTTPLHLQPVFGAPRLPRGLAARDRALRPRMPRAAHVADARQRRQQQEVVNAVSATAPART